MKTLIPAIVILIAAMAAQVVAQEPATRSDVGVQSEDSRAAERVTQGRSGVSVHIDPETGEITGYRRPDPSLLPLTEPLAESLSRSSEGLVSEVMPDGSVVMDLAGRFRHLGVARLGADGQPHVGCFDHPVAIYEFIAPERGPAEALRGEK